jgi:hypothetical protein
MRRLLCLCVVALVLGCGGSPAQKKPDGGGKDATGTTDVGGNVDRVQEALAGDVAGEAAPDGGATQDAPPDLGHEAGDTAPASDASDAAQAADSAGDASSDAAPSDAADAPSDAVEAPSDAADAGETALRLVGFSFAGQVVTVARKGGTGLPLGFDGTVRTERFTGSLSYDPTLLDITVAGDRGKYQSVVGSSFTLTVKGKTITGSTRALMEVENLASSDTFRFRDGPQPLDNTVRIMKLDGVDAPTLSLFIAISGEATMWASDKLPDPFPAIDPTDVPHTFALEDDGGTLLLQMDALTPK